MEKLTDTPDPVVNHAAKMFVPVARPDIGALEADAVRECVMAGRLSQGIFVERFEQEMATAYGLKYGVACSSGTTALHLALEALGIIGDITHRPVVAVPDHTYVAVGNAALYCGADLRFLTGDDAVGNVSIEHPPVSADAIIAAHTFGVPCKINALYERYPPIIEDCAECHYGPVGMRGEVATLSFYANKVITTGEGGMALTNDSVLAKHMKLSRSHSQRSDKRFDHLRIGYNYRMTDVQAAIGLIQHSRRAGIIDRRWTIWESLNNALARSEHHPVARPASPWVFPLLTDHRDALRKHLAERGVETRSYFRPLHTMLHLARFSVNLRDDLDGLAQSIALANRGMYIGIYSGMTDAELNYIIESVLAFKPD